MSGATRVPRPDRETALGAGTKSADSFHIESHKALLQQPPAAAAGRTLDAVIVPTIRPQSLRPAAMLAKELGCALVVLCSTQEQAGRASLELGYSSDSVLVTSVPRSTEGRLLPSRLMFRHPQNDIARSCHIDIARKRNVGMMLARLCGWRTIMYLDDDIRGVMASAVSGVARLSSGFSAAGFQIGHFPDNSVVCHAYRLSGGNQDIFPGGSALVVDADRYHSLFPPIYNEDWLFLFDAVHSHSVAIAGTLTQLKYRPFARRERAASEEFGDVVAEGLFRLLHESMDLADAAYGYWEEALDRRRRLIEDIAARLLLLDNDEPEIGYALMSLAEAHKRLKMISALDCVSFVHAWRTDLSAWRQKLCDQRVVGDLADAAKFLDLPSQNGA